MKLPRKFYLQPTLEVARNLLGKYLVLETKSGKIAGEINEVEAYIGQDDPACHASSGKTARNAAMFQQGGTAYVYFTYGMYYCFNVVTEQEDFPAAVLIRSVIPTDGIEIMLHNRLQNTTLKTKIIPLQNLTNGPGKICQAYGITTEHNTIDLTQSFLSIEYRGKIITRFKTSSRIGISEGKDKLWRLYYEPQQF